MTTHTIEKNKSTYIPPLTELIKVHYQSLCAVSPPLPTSSTTEEPGGGTGDLAKPHYLWEDDLWKDDAEKTESAE